MLVDASGKRLTSVFEGLPVDPQYQQFKRALAERRLTCNARPNRVGRLWQQLGLSFEPVVHADPDCGGCAMMVINWVNCADVCGSIPYDGDLGFTDYSQGIKTGPIVCKDDSGQCSGEPSTQNCSCD
jgi:hypothetical protein